MYKKLPPQLSQSERIQTLVIGAIAGSILGAGTALLFTTNNGQQKHQTFSNKFHGLKDNLVNQGSNMFKDRWTSGSKASPSNTAILLGGIAGGLLVAGTAYLLTQKQETFNQFYQTLSDKSEEFTDQLKDSTADLKAKAGNWVQTASNILDSFHKTLHEGEEKVEKASSDVSQTLNNVLELANMGVRLFQNFTNRR